MAIRKGDRPSTPAGGRAGIHGENYREEGSGGGGKESGLPRASRPGPRQKCITCIAGGASCLGTAHGESSFLPRTFRRALRRRKASGKLYQKPGRSVNSPGTTPGKRGASHHAFPQPRRKQGRIERRVRRSRGCGDPYPKHPKARIRLPSPKRAQTPGAIQRDNAQ